MAACLRAWAAEWVAAWAVWTIKPFGYSLTKAINHSRARKGPAVLRTETGSQNRTAWEVNGNRTAVSNLLL